MAVTLVGLLAAGTLWLGWGVFDRPEAQHEVGSAADGRRAQQKLFRLATSGPGTNPRVERKLIVTVTEGELNALLARHVSIEELPLAGGGIRLVGNGIVEIAGGLPLHAVFGDSLSSVARLLPERWAGKPVWIRLRGHVRLETSAARTDRRRLRLDVESFRVGSRRLPVFVLSLLPEGPALRATRWPVPEAVDSVLVEPGRVTITGRS